MSLNNILPVSLTPFIKALCYVDTWLIHRIIHNYLMFCNIFVSPKVLCELSIMYFNSHGHGVDMTIYRFTWSKKSCAKSSYFVFSWRLVTVGFTPIFLCYFISTYCQWISRGALQWRHNERCGVSNPGVSIVYWTVCSDADQRKHRTSASLAFVRGIHRWPVNSPHKGPVTRKMLPFDDVIMRMWWTNHTDYDIITTN